MQKVIKVPRSEGMTYLEEVANCLTLESGILGEEMTRCLFPLLDMDSWIDHLLGFIPKGRVASFGALAGALGSIRASRAIGERISSGSLEGPTHRVVYSDGTVPDGSALPLSAEVGLKKGNRVDRELFCNLEIEDPPLKVLSSQQERMLPLLTEERPVSVGLVAGIDISSKDGVHAAAMVVMDPGGSGRGEICMKGRPGIPYVSGLLFYREAPLIIPLMRKALETGLTDMDTLCVLDGNGMLHPRRMGIACQIGVATGARTCGVAKRLLHGRDTGEYRQVGGNMLSMVVDGTDIIGSAMLGGRSRKPVYISRGNRIDQVTAESVISSLTSSRVPEPTRRAHDLANRCRRSETPS
ncbi:MAG: endonuclease V [Thermoplasmatota archaeon]